MMTEEKSQDARAIANYILDVAPEYGIKGLTLMQLLKLVYLSHGWSLAFRDTPLVIQAPQAWQYGPVYPHIYRSLGKYGGHPVKERILNKETGFAFLPVNMTKEQKKIIELVLLTYGDMHAFQLSNITHEKGSPWDETIENIGIYKDIPLDNMKKYYKDLAKKRGIEGLLA